MTANVVPGRTVARLRAKNQMTLPEVVVTVLGAEVGDRFLVTVEEGEIRLNLIRKSYFGSQKGTWPPDWMDELRRDRDSWQP